MKKRFTFIFTLTALLWLGTGNLWGEELTVGSGSNTTEYSPFYGNYVDQKQRNQIVYPVSDLSSMSVMEGKNITGIKFYQSNSNAWSGSFTISIAETSGTGFDSKVWFTDELTKVYEGTVTGGTEVTITFQTPYTYGGGNLLLDIQTKTTSSNYKKGTFKGNTNVTTKKPAAYAYNNNVSTPYATLWNLPQTTFTYEEAAAGGCAKPKALTQGAVSTTSATFTWTAGGEETFWQWVCLPAATAVDWSSSAVQTANSATATATGLSAETNYKFYVRANCGSEQSAEVSKAFTTPCAGASLPFEQNFDGEATNTIPSCWSKIASGDYPYVATGGQTGKCMYFYGGASTSSSIIILPPLEEPTNSLVISLAYKYSSSQTYYGTAKIGYMTDPSDASTFHSLKELTTRSTSWNNDAVNKYALTGAPASSYIAIQYSGGTYGSSLYIDDIKVALPSSCTDPSGLTAVAASATTATVSWTENGSAEAWNIQYSTDNFVTHTDVNNVTTNPYTITGLSGNTTYKVRVQSNCGGEQSDWIVSSEFTTPCESVDGIGYSTGFESPTYTYSSYSLPDCWQKIASGNYPYIYNYYKRSGSQCLYFYGGASTSSQIAILPPFNENTSSLSVSLYYNNASDWDDYTGANYGQMSIGYMTNPADASTFTAVATLAKVNTYTLAKVPMIGAPDNSYIAIRYSGGTSNGGLFVDDLEISEVSSCLEPSGVTGLASTPNTASISWTENGSATAWKIRYSSDAGANWSDEVAASTNPFVLTGLTGSSNYIVQVKAICGSEETSDWSVSSPSFPTPCEAIASITDFSFEISEGCTVGGPMPNCWSKLPSAGTYPNVYNYYSKAGSNSLRFYGSAAQYAILPQFSQEVKNLSISFWYRNYYEGVLEVGSMTDPTDASTFKSLATETNISDYGTAITKVNLSGADDGAYYIAFKHSGTNSYDGTYIDLVSVFVTPTCVEPTGVSASDETATSAVIAWTAGGSETAWKLQYSTDGSNWTDANGGENVTNPYTLTGLSASTTYYARVKAVCSVSDESEWSAASAPFKTACAVAALPFSDNFGGADLGCWEMNSCYASTGLYNGAFRFYYNSSYTDIPPQYLISPELDTDGKTVTVEFDYRAESSSWAETFMVGYSTTTKEISAFTWGVEQTATNTSDLTYSENLPVGVKFIAIKHTSDDKYYLYIDNFSVTEYVAPTCPSVVASTLAASAVTANSATVAWTAGDTETAWNLQYKADGGEWSSVIPVATTPSYDLTSLADNTLYYVKVQADCGGDQSEWTADDAFSFRTDCEAVSVSKASPWNYDFEDTNDGFMPLCWERTEPYANYGYPVVAEYSYYAQSGDKYLNFRTPGRSGSSYTEDAILPVFNTEIKNLKVSFSYFNSGTTSNYGQLAIGYVVGDAFMQVGDLLAQVDDYTLVEREMPNDAPDGARIAIRCIGSTKGSSYTTTVYVDDIQVSLKPTCYTPTDLAAVATSNGAVLTWTAGKDETEWQVRYSVKDADSWIVVSDIASTTHTLTGLTVDVAYEAQVRSFCGGEDYSAWSASVNFTPVCGAAPTNLAVSARTTNSATLTWESAESAFLLQTSLDGDNWESPINVNDKTYNLTGLNAGTTYYARVQNACGGEYASASFTTWCDSKLSLPVEFTNFSAIPACWEESPAGAVEVANSKLCFVGEGEKFIYLPQTDVNLNLLSATFTFSGSLEFGYIDAPNGAFHAFASQPASDVELNLENEAATAKYIAIRYHDGGAYTSASISAISVRKTPTCLKPTDLAVSSITANSASVSWTENGTAAAWNLQYKLASAADWTTVAITENPYSLFGLAQGTTYKVRVQAACAGDELSDWSDEVSFATDCSSIASIPWDADFSTNLSNCWTIHCESPEYYSPMISSGGLLIPGGNGGHSNVVVLPGFSTDINGATITLRYQCNAAAGNAAPQIGYVTDKSDASTFAVLTNGTDEIGTLEKSSGYKTVYLPLSALPVGASNLAIRYAGGSSEGDLTINEFRVSHVEIFEDVEGASDNQTRLEALNGQTLDIVLTRSVWRNGDYGTISLPFNLSAAQLADSKCPLNGFAIREYKESEVNTAGNIVDIYLQDVSEITAGDAYFVRYDGSLANLSPLHFRDVTVSSYEPNNTNDGNLSLFGLFNPLAVDANDYGTLFVGSGNALYYPNVAGYIKGFRAYFTVPTSSPLHAPIRNGAPIRISEQKNTPTGFENTEEGHSAQSVKIVENGQLFIIRNGVKYDAQGKKVQ